MSSQRHHHFIPHALLVLATALVSSPAGAGPKVVKLSSEMRPNPLIMESVAFEMPTTVLSKTGFDCHDFEAVMPPQPALTLEVSGAPTQYHVKWSGHFLLKAGKSYWCGNKDFRFEPAPGNYEFYPVVYSYEAKKGNRTGTLIIRDTKRPLVFVDGIRVEKLPATLEKPVVITGLVSSALSSHMPDRRSGMWAAQPDFLVETSAPLTKVTVEIVSGSDQLRLSSFGPLDEMGPQNIPWGDKRMISHDLFTGRTAFWVGAEQKLTGAQTYHVAIYSNKTALDPMTRFTETNSNQSVQARVLARHLPFRPSYLSLTKTDDMIHRRLFMEAQADLFVFALVDVDPDMMTLKEPREVTPPRAGEALLVEQVGVGQFGDGVTVSTADNVSFTVPAKLLTIKPPASIVVPKEPRVSAISYEQLVELSIESERPLVAAQEKLEDAAYTCAREVWKKEDTTGHASQYDIVTYRNGNVVSVENMGERINKLVRKKCPIERAEKGHAALVKKLAAGRMNRRLAELAAIKERLDTLFAPK